MDGESGNIRGPKGYTDPFAKMDLDKLNTFVKPENTLKDALEANIARFCHAMSHIYNKDTGSLKWEWIDKKAVLLSLHAKADQLKQSEGGKTDVDTAKKMIATAEKLQASLTSLKSVINPKHLEEYEDDLLTGKEIISNIITIGKDVIASAEDKFQTRFSTLGSQYKVQSELIEKETAAALYILLNIREECKRLKLEDPIGRDSKQLEELSQKTEIAIKKAIENIGEKAKNLLTSPETTQLDINAAKSFLAQSEAAVNKSDATQCKKEVEACKQTIKDAQSRLLTKDMDVLAAEISIAAEGQMSLQQVSSNLKEIGKIPNLFTPDQSERFRDLSNKIEDLKTQPTNVANTQTESTASAAPVLQRKVTDHDIAVQQAVSELKGAMIALGDKSTIHIREMFEPDPVQQTWNYLASWMPTQGMADMVKSTQFNEADFLKLYDNLTDSKTPEEAKKAAEEIFVHIDNAVKTPIDEENSQIASDVVDEYKKAQKALENLQNLMKPQ